MYEHRPKDFTPFVIDKFQKTNKSHEIRKVTLYLVLHKCTSIFLFVYLDMHGRKLRATPFLKLSAQFNAFPVFHRKYGEVNEIPFFNKENSRESLQARRERK